MTEFMALQYTNNQVEKTTARKLLAKIANFIPAFRSHYSTEISIIQKLQSNPRIAPLLQERYAGNTPDNTEFMQALILEYGWEVCFDLWRAVSNTAHSDGVNTPLLPTETVLQKLNSLSRS